MPDTSVALLAATVILVHGAWADGSSWSKVISRLRQKGIETAAVQNPLTSFDDDVAVVNRAIVSAKGPVALVGHSWAGAVITQAGGDPKVKALIYVAVFAPDVGMSASDPSATSSLVNLRPQACGEPHASHPSVDRASPSNVDRRLSPEKFSALGPSVVLR